MDRFSFSDSLDVSKDVQISNFFNEIMIACNLINGYDIESLSGIVAENNICFEVTFKNSEEAEKAAHALVSPRLWVYDEQYSTTAKLIESTVALIVSKI